MACGGKEKPEEQVHDKRCSNAGMICRSMPADPKKDWLECGGPDTYGDGPECGGYCVFDHPWSHWPPPDTDRLNVEEEHWNGVSVPKQPFPPRG